MDKHRCPVRACQVMVPRLHLMCPPHWAMVPKVMQDSVYGAWDHGKGAGTLAHLSACEMAIRMVNGKLGGV